MFHLDRNKHLLALCLLLTVAVHQSWAWTPSTRTKSTAKSTPINNYHNSRRQVLKSALPILLLPFLPSAPSHAASNKEDEGPIYYDKAEVKAAFDVIRYELEDSKGGIPYLQSKVDAVDYEAILEFTKTYDLEFRKQYMLGAKKKFKLGGDKPEAVQQMLNNVTFDLIGMNKSCRKGQENIQLTQKYLDELKTDVAQYLELEKTVLTTTTTAQ